MKKSPCEACGACCAFFRVLFPTTETNSIGEPAVPIGYTLPFNLSQHLMKGTEMKNPRCMALEGKVGVGVRCTIYAHRPSTCRNFNRSWEKNRGNIQCDRARAIFGLLPFSQY